MTFETRGASDLRIILHKFSTVLNCSVVNKKRKNYTGAVMRLIFDKKLKTQNNQ